MIASRLVVDCDLPGGNIEVDAIEGNTLLVHQDVRDTMEAWFYWYFRVRNAAGRELKVHFTQSDAIGVRGPAVSIDQGKSWHWLGNGSVKGNAFTIAVSSVQDEVRFSFGMPYLQADLERFLQPFAENPFLKQKVLCTSRKGRPVEVLFVGAQKSDATFHALLTCRHHCCEMMVSYVLEGLVQAVLADTLSGAWMRENVAFVIVPFVDKDGVEDGDQGKLRRPHDHNRDYVGESIYPEVAAIRQQAPQWSNGKLDLALDLHCPWIKGFLNEFIYFVGVSDQAIWEETNRLSKVLAIHRKGAIPFYQETNLPYGRDWNTESEHSRKWFADWASALPGVRIASTIEIPYANAFGVEVNPENVRAFGRDLAEAIAVYLQSL
jgi:hypothetical protein